MWSSGHYGYLVICLSCHLVIWSSGHLIIRSSGQYGHLVRSIRSSRQYGDLVILSSNHLVIWSSLHLVTLSSDHLVNMVILSSGQSGHLVIWSSGHLVIWSFTILWKTVLFFWNTGIICTHNESCFGDLIEQSGYLVFFSFQLGDVISLVKRRDDGWCKGTLHRTGKTGLFPASFVEKI